MEIDTDIEKKATFVNWHKAERDYRKWKRMIRADIEGNCEEVFGKSAYGTKRYNEYDYNWRREAYG